jgi:hypothetical protein
VLSRRYATTQLDDELGIVRAIHAHVHTPHVGINVFPGIGNTGAHAHASRFAPPKSNAELRVGFVVQVCNRGIVTVTIKIHTSPIDDSITM